MPDRIIKNSRPVGGKKRGRPPKQQTPVPESTPEPTSSIPVTDKNSGIPPSALVGDTGSEQKFSFPFQINNPLPSFLNPLATFGNGNVVQNTTDTSALISQRYTGIEQINHALNIPSFDANSYMPTDLFSVSSSLDDTLTDGEADVMLGQIKRQGNKVKVAKANIGLVGLLVDADSAYKKVEGQLIDRQTIITQNDTKYINYQSALVDRSIADVKFQQKQETLTQENAALTGMKNITPLVTAEWQARKALKESKIGAINYAVDFAAAKLDEQLRLMASEFISSDV